MFNPRRFGHKQPNQRSWLLGFSLVDTFEAGFSKPDLSLGGAAGSPLADRR
jgi:hypothetical protein